MILSQPKLILAFITAFAALALAACGGSTTTVETPASPVAAAPAPTAAVAQAAPVATAAPPATAIPAAPPAPAATAVPTATVAPTPTFLPAPTAAPAEPLEIIATTAFVADWVANVGGDRANVTSLVPRNVDPHTFNPGARDIARVADADLIFGIGLTLEEGWLIDLIQNASRDPDAFIALGEGVDPIEFGADMHDDEHEDEHDHEDGDEHDEDGDDHEDGDEHDEDGDDHEDGDEHDEDGDDHEDGDEHDEDEDEHDHEDGDEHDEDGDDHEDGDEHDEDEDEHDHEDGDEHDEDEDEHDHGAFDPHFWFDPVRVGVAVDDIAARMSAMDAANADFYAANAADYKTSLAQLDAWVHEVVDTIPDDQRKLATSHDALGYYALRYGFEVVGVVIAGGGTEAEPSAQEIAALIDRLRDEGVKAMFTETTVSDALTLRVADEAGATIVNTLYTGGLSAPDGEAGTYLDFMRYNTTTIVDALK